MGSQIDIKVPVFGDPKTEDVRRNFEIAASEITKLQEGMSGINTPDGVIDALGYTPYDAANPEDYQTDQQVTDELNARLSTALPPQDGLASAGTGTHYAREDHVHPTDLSRYAANNPAHFQSDTDVAASLAALLGTALPLQDGTAAVGTGTRYSREDHVHPTDTSRYAASNPANYQTDQQVGGAISSALALYIPQSQIGAVSGVAALDASGKVPSTQLPSAATGVLNYKGGWDPVLNQPALSSGAHIGAGVAPNRDYYLATRAQATLSPAIDTISTINAGDWMVSNGTTWERLQNGTTPYVPLAGGVMTGGLTAPSFAIASTDTWSAASALEPDFAWTLRGQAGNIPVGLDVIGNFVVASLIAYNAQVTLAADPTTPLAAVTKQYSDANVASLISNSLPVMAGAASAGVGTTLSRYDHRHPVDTSRAAADAASITTSLTVATTGEVWQPSMIPDWIWTITGADGSIPVAVDYTGLMLAAAINVGTLTVGTFNYTGPFSTSLLTATSINVLGDVQDDAGMIPDLVGTVRGANGNVVFGFDAVTGETQAASINAGALKVNGQAISGGGASTLTDTLDVRDPAYGGQGTALRNWGRVTTSGSTLTLVNFHGSVTLTATNDATTWQLTIANQRWDGWAFQPWHDGKLCYIESDDGTFKLLASVKQHLDGSNILLTAPSSTLPQAGITASVTAPAFDPSMSLSPVTKYICVDGMGKEGWWSYDPTTGAPVQRNLDTVTPYGNQTFISRISTIVSPKQITIAVVSGATPSNAAFQMNVTDLPTLVQWGPNDVDAACLCARAAYDKGIRRIKFTGGGHYLLLGACVSGQWLSRYVPSTTQDAGALTNGVLWQSDGATTWMVTDGAAMFAHRPALPGARQSREAQKRISGRLHLPRCAAKPVNLPLNIYFDGDSLGSLNPQSQVTMVMGVMRFMDEFQRQNPNRQINYYCGGIGGATWASLASTNLLVNNNSNSVKYGSMPKPLAGAPMHRAFYANINQTGIGAPIVPDVVVMFLNAGNDAYGIDVLSLHTVINLVRNQNPSDGYGPPDLIMQTDVFVISQYYNGTMLVPGGVTIPDPHAKLWFHEYATTMNRSVAANRGFGLVDYADLNAKAAFGNDLVRRQLRQIPSATWNLSPSTPVAFAPRCRDFAFWFTLPGSNDAAAWASLIEISFQLSLSAGNRLLLRRGPNGNIWIAQTACGHWVDTVVTTTAGSPTISLGPVSSATVTGLLVGKAPELFLRSGLAMDAGFNDKMFILPTGNNDGAVGRRPQRNYFRAVQNANHALTFDRSFDVGDVSFTNVAMSYGGQQFVQQDKEAATDISIIYPDGTLFTSNVLYGSSVTATQATMQDNAPQSLNAQTVSLFLGRMAIRWFDTGITPDAAAIGVHELNVSRERLAFGYATASDFATVPIIGTKIFRTLERFGGEFNCEIRAKGTQQVVANNMWIDEDEPVASTCPPWELRGWFDANSADERGGTAGHFGSRLRSEVLDPLYATQDLSTR